MPTEDGKKIMVIAGGEWQIPIIMKAKQMGLFVINTNLYEDSPVSGTPTWVSSQMCWTKSAISRSPVSIC
jgi:hypothetical protein